MKNILITGASKGLGLEFTTQYLQKGEKVIATCRNPDTAIDLHKLQQKYPNHLFILKLDVTEDNDRNEAFEETDKNFEAIDILINNAGIVAGDERNPSILGEVYKEDFSKVMLVNSISPLLLSEKFLPLLETSEAAKIINISSQNGSITKRSVGGKYSYAASKAALNMITKILSNDLREKGIVTLVVHPGWIKTNMGGPEAPLQKEGPISNIIDLIERSDLSDSGKFLDWEGNEVPW
ncbi:MAG: SDR family oxidoreductase [Candidatus Kariarchaeaceae archaeon]|jgi:NAD(P)-dependent dehydrogenase (short-subunit alcohol dehydrogenase family)